MPKGKGYGAARAAMKPKMGKKAAGKPKGKAKPAMRGKGGRKK